MHTNNDNYLWLRIATRSSVVACVMPIGRRLLIVKRWVLHQQKHTVQVSINIHCDLPVCLLIGSLKEPWPHNTCRNSRWPSDPGLF